MTAPHTVRALASGDWRGSEDADQRDGRDHLTDGLPSITHAKLAKMDTAFVSAMTKAIAAGLERGRR